MSGEAVEMFRAQVASSEAAPEAAPAAEAKPSGAVAKQEPFRTPPVEMPGPASEAPENDNAIPDENAQPDVEDPEQQLEEPAPDEAAELEQLRQLKQQIEGDEWPDELLQKQRKVSINGQEHYVTAAEAFQGYMRNADYSRKLREVTETRDYAQKIRAGTEVLMERLKDPEQLLATAKRLGFYPAVFQAAKQIATERYKLNQLPPEARQYALQLAEERDARAQMQLEREQLERQLQERQAQEPDETATRVQHQLQQLIPRAFKKHALGDYPLAQDLFKRNIESLYQGGDVTAELVDQAAQATAENLADIARRLPQAKQGNGALPPRKAAVGNGKPLQRQTTSGKTQDFRAHIDRLGNR